MLNTTNDCVKSQNNKCSYHINVTFIQDKTHRPGLSVHLSTEIIKNVYAGEKVTVLTQADKLGKTIGFCSMELLNSKGELVARGRQAVRIDVQYVVRILHASNFR